MLGDPPPVLVPFGYSGADVRPPDRANMDLLGGRQEIAAGRVGSGPR